MMDETRNHMLIATLIAAARDYNRPPPVPREEVWARVEAARRQAAGTLLPRPRRNGTAPPGGAGERIHLRVRARPEPRRRRTRPGLLASIAVAASILIAMAIGEFGIDRPQAWRDGTGPAPGSAATSTGSTLPYEVAAAEHLGEAETLLAFFQAAARRGDPDPATAEWARDLVSTTRLFMDSPAAEDPSVHELLQDLELLLVQIAQVREQDHLHLDIIEQGIEEGNVMMRLAAAYPTGPASR